MRIFAILVLFTAFMSSTLHAADIESEWFLVGVPSPTPEEYEVERQIRHHFTDRIGSCLHAAQLYRPYMVGVLNNGEEGYRFAEHGGATPPDLTPGGTLFVLYGKEAAESSGLPTPFAAKGRGEVFVPAATMSDAWFCAGIIFAVIEREYRGDDSIETLVHARMQAHEKVREYLSDLTRGRYLELLAEIGREMRPEMSFAPDEGARALATLFPPSLSPMEEEVRFVQFFADVINAKGSEKITALIGSGSD
jgi:hypothetical protein